MDTLPNNYFLLKKIPANGRKQASYWEKAFEIAGIPNDNNGDDVSEGCFDLDTLIISLKEKLSPNLVQLNILCFYYYSNLEIVHLKWVFH